MKRTSLAAALVALPAAQPLYSLAVRFVLRRTVRNLRQGRVDRVLRVYSDDVRFVFPGENTWAADFRGKAELEPWFERFVRVGLQLEAHDILVSGPPWDSTVCLRFTDQATARDGRVVYENRGVIFLKIRWGKVVYEEAYEDTERVAGFDRWLAEHERTGAASPGFA